MKALRCLLAAALALAGTCWTLPAASAAESVSGRSSAWVLGDPALPEEPPLCVVEFPAHMLPGDAAIRPGSDKIVLLRQVRAVKVWPALAQWWFEAAAGAVLLGGLFLLFRVRRAAWARAKGRAVRVSALLLLLVAVPAGAVGLRGRVPRNTWLGELLACPSTAAYDWAEEHELWWLLSHKVGWTELVEVDPATGRTLRELARREAPVAGGRLAVGPGDTLYVAWLNDRWGMAGPIERIDLSAGAAVQTTGWPSSGSGYGDRLARFEASRSGDGLCVVLEKAGRHSPPIARSGRIWPPTSFQVGVWSERGDWSIAEPERASPAYCEYVQTFAKGALQDSCGYLRHEVYHETTMPHVLPMVQAAKMLLLDGDASDAAGPAALRGTAIDLLTGRRERLFDVPIAAPLRDGVALELADGRRGLVVRTLEGLEAVTREGEAAWTMSNEHGEALGVLRLPKRYDYATIAASADEGRLLLVNRRTGEGEIGLEWVVDILDPREAKWKKRMTCGSSGLAEVLRLAASERFVVLLDRAAFQWRAPGAASGRLVVWDLGDKK